MDVKEAVRKAAFELANLLDVPEQNLLLEEAEYLQNGDANCWSVTFSYPVRKVVGERPTLAEAFGNKPPREYKTILIDAETGAFKAIRMKTLAG